MATELPKFNSEEYNQEVDASLEEMARRAGVYYKALMWEKIPSEVAGHIIVAWQKATIEAETQEWLQRRELADRRLRAGRF